MDEKHEDQELALVAQHAGTGGPVYFSALHLPKRKWKIIDPQLTVQGKIDKLLTVGQCDDKLVCLVVMQSLQVSLVWRTDTKTWVELPQRHPILSESQFGCSAHKMWRTNAHENAFSFYTLNMQTGLWEEYLHKQDPSGKYIFATHHMYRITCHFDGVEMLDLRSKQWKPLAPMYEQHFPCLLNEFLMVDLTPSVAIVIGQSFGGHPLNASVLFQLQHRPPWTPRWLHISFGNEGPSIDPGMWPLVIPFSHSVLLMNRKVTIEYQHNTRTWKRIQALPLLFEGGQACSARLLNQNLIREITGIRPLEDSEIL